LHVGSRPAEGHPVLLDELGVEVVEQARSPRFAELLIVVGQVLDDRSVAWIQPIGFSALDQKL